MSVCVCLCVCVRVSVLVKHSTEMNLSEPNHITFAHAEDCLLLLVRVIY